MQLHSNFPIIVAKFGGTSVANFEALQRCADIIQNNPSIRLVVVSAAAGVTNRLAELAAGVADKAARSQLLSEIMQIQHAYRPNSSRRLRCQPRSENTS